MSLVCELATLLVIKYDMTTWAKIREWIDRMWQIPEVKLVHDKPLSVLKKWIGDAKL